ncbi:acyltransferase family protein [Mucilaginibacter sp. BT774]|uniref:acyltransferase family protein n=1 Tax=Mucilaginibacter sp. BT774 TaxID=3062276 RepID=UPI00349FEC38
MVSEYPIWKVTLNATAQFSSYILLSYLFVLIFNSMLNEPYKLLSIQYLRGLAALGVVFCHFGFALTNYPVISSVFNLGQIGVPVFFFISGFIIAYSLEKNGYKTSHFFTFLIKRSIRIDPPYWVVIALYILLGFTLNHLSAYRGVVFRYDFAQFIAHIFYAVPFTRYSFYNHIFWTLCVEFQFYLLIGLLYFLFKSKAYKVIFLLAFGVINLFHFGGDALILNYTSIFALGISFMVFYNNRTLHNIVLPIIFITLILYRHGFATAAVLLISSVAVIFVNFRLNALYFLGNISYSLYLTHFLVFEICNGIFKRMGIIHLQFLCFSMELVVAILFAWLFYIFFERPAIRLSKSFIYLRRPKLDVKSTAA